MQIKYIVIIIQTCDSSLNFDPSLLSPRLSKALPVFNRCTPVDISCYAKFAEAVVTFVSDNSVLHRLIAGVAASKEIIVGLCLLALGEGQLTTFHIEIRNGSCSHFIPVVI